MARQYVVTDEEFRSLVERVKTACDLRETEPGLSAEELNRLRSIHKGVQFQIVQWMRSVGMDRIPGEG